MTRTTRTLRKVRAAWAEFEQGFQRSRRGRLWQHFEGMTLVVFERQDGWFAWCIADNDGPRFSKAAYETEQDAMEALGDELAIGS